MDQESPKIHVSTNYDNFKYLYFNREVNRNTVNRLVKITREKNRMMYYPVIVDHELQIIDGQHRFEACKQLNLPIYYVVMDASATWKDVYSMNTTGKKHSISELIMLVGKYGQNEGSDLSELVSIHDDYKDTPMLIGTLANLFFEFYNHSGKTVQAIKEGKFKIKYREETCLMLAFLDNMRNIGFQDWCRNKFIFAITKIISRYKLDYESFLIQLDNNKEYINKQGNKRDYIAHLIAVHDRNLKGGKRLVPSMY